MADNHLSAKILFLIPLLVLTVVIDSGFDIVIKGFCLHMKEI